LAFSGRYLKYLMLLAGVNVYTKNVCSFFITPSTVANAHASGVSQTVGEFDGHYSGFAFNPASGFGAIVLMTGTYRDTESIVIEIFKHFQPAFDVLQVKAAIDTYAGHWRSKDGESEALISVVDGSLWLDKYSVKGNDLLAILRDDKPEKMALASTGRKHEFRYVVHFCPFNVKN
jgi:hypothetical protein